MAFKKYFSFLCGQLRQVQTKGFGVFFEKVQKAGSLFYMNVIAPVIVCLNIDWPQACYSAGTRYMRKYKKCSLRYAGTKKQLKEIAKTADKAILCMEKYVAHKPDLSRVSEWINANTVLFTMSIHRNRNKEGIHQKTADVVQEIIRKHQLDKLGVEFIPRGFAVGSIGSVENVTTYIQAGLLGMRSPKKLILLMDPGSTVNNPHYLSYWSPFVTIVSDPFLIQALSPLEQCLAVPIGFYTPLGEKALSSPFALGMIREQWNKQQRGPFLTISDEDYDRGWRCLKDLGVPRDAWFVCLHVRESGWNDQGSLSESFRNADIHSFLPAIKSITDAGGWVIRMGDSSMKPLDKMDHVIDYAHSNVKSDWMDVFLCSQNRFFIGTSSGVFTMAMAFGVPVVVTNLLPAMGMYQLSSADIILPRVCRSRVENRLLTFRELISPPFGRAFSQHHYDYLDIEAIENTPEEIRDVIGEMLGRVNGTVQYSEENEYLQKRFKSLTAGCGALYGDKDITMHARIGQSFLRKYAALLPSDKKEDAPVGV